MSTTNTKADVMHVESRLEANKLLSCKRVWVWGEARSWLTGNLCPESSNIPKEEAVMVDGLSAWHPQKGFTWGESVRGYSRASKTKPT